MCSIKRLRLKFGGDRHRGRKNESELFALSVAKGFTCKLNNRMR